MLLITSTVCIKFMSIKLFYKEKDQMQNLVPGLRDSSPIDYIDDSTNLAA